MEKQSFTYSGTAKVRKAAIAKAKKEGMKFSDLVERLLKAYVAAQSWKTFEKPPRQITPSIELSEEDGKWEAVKGKMRDAETKNKS
jgi:hypothetical protein